MSEIKILGAYGTKGQTKETSSFFLNERHVIDAGNLLRSLQERSAHIEAVWLTHSHLDHIIDIAYILDSYFAERKAPLRLMGLDETLEAVQTHFLNDLIWPDFSKISLMRSMKMSVEFVPIKPGVSYSIGDTMSIEAFATDHTVPSCGYVVKENADAVLITADTYSLESVLEQVENRHDINALVIECSFPSSMEALATESKHLTPRLLFDQLRPLEGRGLKLYINHIKPLYEERIRGEIAKLQGAWETVILADGDKILF